MTGSVISNFSADSLVGAFGALEIIEKKFGKRPQLQLDALVKQLMQSPRVQALDEEQRIGLRLFLSLSASELEEMQRFLYETRVVGCSLVRPSREHADVLAYFAAYESGIESYSLVQLTSVAENLTGSDASILGCIGSYSTDRELNRATHFFFGILALIEAYSLMGVLPGAGTPEATELNKTLDTLEKFMIEQESGNFIWYMCQFENSIRTPSEYSKMLDVLFVKLMNSSSFEPLKEYADGVLSRRSNKNLRSRKDLEQFFYARQRILTMGRAVANDKRVELSSTEGLLAQIYEAYGLFQAISIIEAMGIDGLAAGPLKDSLIAVRDCIYCKIDLTTIYNFLQEATVQPQDYMKLLQLQRVLLVRQESTPRYSPSSVAAMVHATLTHMTVLSLELYCEFLIAMAEKPEAAVDEATLSRLRYNAWKGCMHLHILKELQKESALYGTKLLAVVAEQRLDLITHNIEEDIEAHLLPVVYEFLKLSAHEMQRVLGVIQGPLQSRDEAAKIGAFLESFHEREGRRLREDGNSLYGALFDQIDNSASLVLEFTGDHERITRSYYYQGLIGQIRVLVLDSIRMDDSELNLLQSLLVQFLEKEPPEMRIRRLSEFCDYAAREDQFGAWLRKGALNQLLATTPLPVLFKQVCSFIGPHAQVNTELFLNLFKVLEHKECILKKQDEIEQVRGWLERLKSYMRQLYVSGNVSTPARAGLGVYMKLFLHCSRVPAEAKEKIIAHLNSSHAEIMQQAPAACDQSDANFFEALLYRSYILKSIDVEGEELQALSHCILQYACKTTLHHLLRIYSFIGGVLTSKVQSTSYRVFFFQMALQISQRPSLEKFIEGIQEMRRGLYTVHNELHRGFYTMLACQINKIVYSASLDQSAQLQRLVTDSVVPLLAQFPSLASEANCSFIEGLMHTVVGRDAKDQNYKSELQALLWTMQAHRQERL